MLQGFVRPLSVVLVPEHIELPLFPNTVALDRRDRAPHERPVQAFVRAVLLRLAGWIGWCTMHRRVH